jgi:hypothetical protein
MCHFELSPAFIEVEKELTECDTYCSGNCRRCRSCRQNVEFVVQIMERDTVENGLRRPCKKNRDAAFQECLQENQDQVVDLDSGIVMPGSESGHRRIFNFGKSLAIFRTTGKSASRQDLFGATRNVVVSDRNSD